MLKDDVPTPGEAAAPPQPVRCEAADSRAGGTFRGGRRRRRGAAFRSLGGGGLLGKPLFLRFDSPIVGRFPRETEGFSKISLSGVGRSRQTGDSRLNQREPRQEGATKGILACGLGRGSVLTIHRIVIHCRTHSLRESPHRATPKKSAQRRRKPTTAVGVSPAGASPQSGVFPARQGAFQNKPELRCGSDDKQRSGKARLCRARFAVCHPFLRSVRLILKSLLARRKRTLFSKTAHPPPLPSHTPKPPSHRRPGARGGGGGLSGSF